MDARIWRTRPNMRSICRAAQCWLSRYSRPVTATPIRFTRTLAEAQSAAREIHERAVAEVVADKDYHSGAVLKELHQQGVRTYIPEPDRGRRKWQGKGSSRSGPMRIAGECGAIAADSYRRGAV